MSTKRFALPPGVCYVQTTESPSRNVVNPGTDGQQLFVASPSGADDQKWLISGDGVMRAFSVKSGSFAQITLSSSSVPQAITRAMSGVEWIISVEWYFKDQIAKREGIAVDEEIMPSCVFKYSPSALVKS